LAENKTSVEAYTELANGLRGGSVDTLLILGCNPAFDGIADLDLNLQGSKNRPIMSIHLGLFQDETASHCTWHAPVAHFLEAWGDGLAWDGTYGIQQPLIHPLFAGISELEMLSLTMGKPVKNGLELVRATAREQFAIEADQAWQQLLHDGVLAESQFEPVAPPQAVLPKPESISSPVAGATGLEFCFVGNSSTFDGRFGNNGWLQEMPDPLTKMTWGNAALISKQDADHFKLKNGDGIAIHLSERAELPEIPVLIQPGQMPGSLTLTLGYGRTAGYIARSVGTDVNCLRTSANRYLGRGATITRTGNRHEIACTQDHFLMDAVGKAGLEFRVGQQGRPGTIVRETSLLKHRQDPHEVHASFHSPKPAPMFDPPSPLNSPSAWGMSIDLNKCIGCNGCVIACQSENNIPVVGKANVMKNREMHWLRIDRYFKGEIESPDVVHVPMACAHCENAPCEQVCPVAATVHDTEGLNAMVYNRCIGTRYCANNCPYKVRRFNYLDFHSSRPKAPVQPWLGVPDEQPGQEIPELVQMGFNPDVSVRMRGVMEKCTYCVQRISSARIQARNDYAKGNRTSPLPVDGEVVTACQQACPTNAIQFGDLNDKQSIVVQSHHDDRAYSMLEELNIKPRTKYLARIRNVAEAPSENYQSGGNHEHA
jgi:Fe-S-cluster-containing dehydrogenase component